MRTSMTSCGIPWAFISFAVAVRRAALSYDISLSERSASARPPVPAGTAPAVRALCEGKGSLRK
jgi:hypothetical protein